MNNRHQYTNFMRILVIGFILLTTCEARAQYGTAVVPKGAITEAQPGIHPLLPIRDTIRIHDTIYQPVPLYQVSDTGAFVYLTRSNSPVLKSCFVIRQGFKQNTPQGLQWVEEPRVIGIYSKRWKLIDRKKIQKIL